jgi:hypothetical protein
VDAVCLFFYPYHQTIVCQCERRTNSVELDAASIERVARSEGSRGEGVTT